MSEAPRLGWLDVSRIFLFLCLTQLKPTSSSLNCATAETLPVLLPVLPSCPPTRVRVRALGAVRAASTVLGSLRCPCTCRAFSGDWVDGWSIDWYPLTGGSVALVLPSIWFCLGWFGVIPSLLNVALHCCVLRWLYQKPGLILLIRQSHFRLESCSIWWSGRIRPCMARLIDISLVELRGLAWVIPLWRLGMTCRRPLEFGRGWVLPCHCCRSVERWARAVYEPYFCTWCHDDFRDGAHFLCHVEVVHPLSVHVL